MPINTLRVRVRVVGGWWVDLALSLKVLSKPVFVCDFEDEFVAFVMWLHKM